MVVELADFYKSLKRREAAEKEKGIRPVQVGKEALPFNIYKMLAQHFVESGNVFAWAYLVVSWNLICRTKNTESLKLSHIEWNEDAMIVYFAKMQNDQGEEAGVEESDHLLLTQKYSFRG